MAQWKKLSESEAVMVCLTADLFIGTGKTNQGLFGCYLDTTIHPDTFLLTPKVAVVLILYIISGYLWS